MLTSIAYRPLLGVALVCVVVGWTFLLSMGSPAFAEEPTPPTETSQPSEPPASEPTPPEPTPSEPPPGEPEPVAEPVGSYCSPPDTATPETTCYVQLTDSQLRHVRDSAAKVELAAAVLVFFVSLHVVASFGRRGRG